MYDCDPTQLTFLRLLSDHAKQSITYHCLNSSAWFKQSSGSYQHSIKLKADNGIEIHASGTKKYAPTIVLDECKVGKDYQGGVGRGRGDNQNSSKFGRKLPNHATQFLCNSKKKRENHQYFYMHH